VLASRHALFVVLVAALAVRAVVAWQLHDHPLLQPVGQLDSGVYVELGRQVARGDLLLRTATDGEPFFLAPLYVYFLGFALALGHGSLGAAKLLQAALGTAAVALLYGAARPWFGRPAALVAAALLAATGPVVFHEAILLQSALDPFLIALALVGVSRALGSRGGPAWALAGAALGLFSLNRPNALAWGAALALALPLARGARRGGREGAALALGLALAVAPITLRNFAVSGEPVLVSSHGGLNLYIGNRADADGTYRHVPGITPDIQGQARDARRLAEAAAGRSLSAREVDAHFRALAADWTRSHPLDAGRLFLRKLAYVFSAAEISLNYSYAYYALDEPTLLRWPFVGAWLLVPLGLLGLGARLWSGTLGERQPTGGRWCFALWALVVPVYAASVAVFFVSARYRLPLLVPLAAGAGFALVRAVGAGARRETRQLAVSAAALAPLCALAFWPHRLDDGRWFMREDMVVWLVEQDRVDEALERLARAERGHPTPERLLFRAGRALQLRGRAGEALPLLERALARDPGRAELRFALGQALLDLGRAAQAEPHLRAAVEAGVRPDLAGFDLARALAVLGRKQEALGALRAVPRPEPTDAASLFAVGRLLLDLGDASLAEPSLAHAAGLRPDSAPAQAALAEARVALGRFEGAIPPLQAACRIAPGDPTLRLNLAAIYAQSGRIPEARTAAEAALRLRPGDPKALALLSMLGPR
jgi:tetratricopeptide (TPR) repeat protein